MRKVVHAEAAPRAVGPYSQAIVAAGCVWASGQIPLDPATGEMVRSGIEDETRRVLQNLRAVLLAAGSDLARAIKCTVYLTDLADFEVVNGVYGEFFEGDPPARVCVEVAALPKGASVEIDAVALAGS